MNSATIDRLLELNRRFYDDRGGDFSATRLRLQPGVQHLLTTLRGDESILDLGCGNGRLARALSERRHRGSYLGLDFSPALLAESGHSSFGFPVRFVRCDLSQPSWDQAIAVRPAGSSAADSPRFDVIFCFAVLHHLPGSSLRSGILCKANNLLSPDGRLMLSNWRFAQSPRMSGRIQAWSAAGLTAMDVDPNDHLVDWRRGGRGLRYVHQFDEAELAELASAAGFEVAEAFYSDGADRKSGLYQVWKKIRT